MAEMMLAHNVFFQLEDSSEPAVEKLIADCKRYLAPHEGIVFFACGSLAKELNRDVNDRDFDVALHIVFRTKADHDAYQSTPGHQQFIEANKENWKQVRVFDSVVETVSSSG